MDIDQAHDDKVIEAGREREATGLFDRLSESMFMSAQYNGSMSGEFCRGRAEASWRDARGVRDTLLLVLAKIREEKDNEGELDLSRLINILGEGKKQW